MIYNLKAQKQPDLPTKEAEKKQKEEQKKIDSAVPLTEEEQAEKAELLTQVYIINTILAH